MGLHCRADGLARAVQRMARRRGPEATPVDRGDDGRRSTVSPPSTRRRRDRRLLSLGGLLVFLLGAAVAAGLELSEERGVQVAAPQPSPAPASEPEPAPEPEAEPGPDLEPDPEPEPAAPWPLTGVEADDEEALERPFLAAKLDNHPAARPQSGLAEADLVIVELVEGRTRLVPVWHSQWPEVIGPVRSGRLADADILAAFAPAVAMSGADTPVWPELRSTGLPIVSEGDDGYYREPSRRGPHNLYLETAALVEAAAEQPAGEALLRHDGQTPEGGQPAEAATLSYPSGAGTTTWRWQGQGWSRLEDGEDHLDPDGEPLVVASVAVLTVDWVGAERRPFEPLGEGQARYLRDGEVFEGTWRLPERGDPYELLDADGEPFPLAEGPLWVELLPSIGSLALESG